MRRGVNRVLVGSFFVLFLASFGQPASATVLTFEGLTSAQAESMAFHEGYGGFVWDESWYLFADTSYSPPGSVSPHYGIVNNFGSDPISITSATPFDFTGTYVAQWSFNAPSSIRIVGYDALNVVVGDTGNVAIGPSYAFVTANFSNVSRVDFVGGQYFALDNVTVGESSTVVPEPASLLLLGTGLFGTAYRRRRSRRA